MEFKEFEKIARLNREIVITEKIDGTNSQVHISPATGGESDYEDFVAFAENDSGKFILRAGSRNRFITPSADNFGFAAWVKANARDLLGLGEGIHYGEWWGSGIQRRYGLNNEKRWSLFNVARWTRHDTDAPLSPKQQYAPRCCHVVPVLKVGIGFHLVDEAIEHLRTLGSVAAPGFMDPEGVVAFHTAARSLFKVTLRNDNEPKSVANASSSPPNK